MPTPLSTPSTMFRVNWPFSSEEEVKYRFSRWPPSWISDRKDFCYFSSTSHPDPPYQFSNQLALWFRKISKKEFQDGHHLGISDPNNLSYFKSTSPWVVNLGTTTKLC